MAEDRIPELAGRVRALEHRPLAEHPDVLDEVHEAIVAELDEVGGWQHTSGNVGAGKVPEGR